jgi:type IV pilus assembly protein PilO
MANLDYRDPNVQIAGMVVTIAAAIGYIFFLTPILPFGYKVKKDAIAQLEGEYETLSADLMKAKQTASRLPQVRAEHEALVQQWEEAKNLLPTEQEMAELLSQVTVAGQRSGVEFLLFEPKPAVPREIYMENPVEVTVQGGFHEIGLFAGRLSNLPRIVNVKSLDLKSVPNPVDAELPEVVQASMSLAAYTLIPEGNRGQMAAPRAEAGGGSRGEE